MSSTTPTVITPLNPSKTALLLLDLQVGFLQRLPAQDCTTLLSSVSQALTTSRAHGLQVVYIRAALTSAEVLAVSDNNPSFSPIKNSAEMAVAFHPDSPTTQIHADIAPREGESVRRKIRFGPFMVGESRELLGEWEGQGIDTVVIGGVITSGAVLSAVRQLADLDYRVLVLEDCCRDWDEEVHEVLLGKVFPRQAQVVRSEELEGMLK